MPVPRNDAAIDVLTTVLTQGHHDRPAELVEYPGYAIHDPQGWLWRDAQTQPPLQQPDAYDLTDALPGTRLHESPGLVLDTSGGTEPFTAEQQEYCRRSLDVTMKGGTTSGVIYPLALCELARNFRFRNLGGASAGAIAASLAAAAELGRTRRAAGLIANDTRDAEQIAQGRLRQGFAGLSDILAWLTQRDRPNGPDEFRLVQLFKPTLAGLPLFRVLASAMRGQFVRGALLLLVSLNARALALTLVPFVLAPWALSASAPWRWGGGWLSVGNYWYSVLLLWLAFGWVIPLVSLWLTRPRRTPSAQPSGFEEPIPTPPPPVEPRRWMRTLTIAVVAGLGWVAATLHALGWVGLLLTVAYLVAEIAFVLLGFGIGVALFSTTAKDHRFGLIGGSGAATDDRTWRGRLARLFESATRVLPETTVNANLTDWLTDAMTDLAGLAPGEVLRFGHLWTGAEYTPGDPDGAGRRAAENSRLRSINLELMSTELIRRAPYRFPLPAADSTANQLWFDPDDLAGLLPAQVIAAMMDGAAPVRVRALATGAEVVLYPFPQPWDLPVVFATRASLALPALFQAVRLYELREGSTPVRTEFGARVARDGTELRWPGADGAAPVAQELWLTDGGVTSNFPIHLFDSPLPLWPTVGIDLGTHPAGAGHQDVYLLGDAGAAKTLATPLGRAMSSFLASVIGTGLQWRDTAQLGMPAFQARIAVVRQRSYEGGNNLFMTTDDIASLALRGVVAGMRLRRRFASDAQWERQQWLRLRVAAESLARFSNRLQVSLREQSYARLLPEPDGAAPPWAVLDALRDNLTGQADPNPPVALPDDPDPAVEWYRPDTAAFFDELDALLEPARDGTANPAVLRDGAPRPFAELRQVPRD
ncbi:MAG: patatin-like phospholipase family protein [Micropruina sp.]